MCWGWLRKCASGGEGVRGVKMKEVIGGVRELGEELSFCLCTLNFGSRNQKKLQARVHKRQQQSHTICAERFCCVQTFGAWGKDNSTFPLVFDIIPRLYIPIQTTMDLGLTCWTKLWRSKSVAWLCFLLLLHTNAGKCAPPSSIWVDLVAPSVCSGVLQPAHNFTDRGDWLAEW